MQQKNNKGCKKVSGFVCVCVCARARARVCVCVCVCDRSALLQCELKIMYAFIDVNVTLYYPGTIMYCRQHRTQ